MKEKLISLEILYIYIENTTHKMDYTFDKSFTDH